MPRLYLYVNHLVVLLVLTLGVSMAQKTTYLDIQPDRLRHAREAEKEAKAKNDPLLLAEAWYLYGKTYVFSGDYRTAQSYFLKSLRIHEPLGDSFELSRLYVRLSENEDRLGRSKQALHYANLSLAVAQRIQSDKALLRAYGALAQIYQAMWEAHLPRKQLDYNRVFFYYKKRESLCYKLSDTLGIGEVSIELGTLFTKVKDPRAIPYLEKALYLFTLKNKDGIRVNTMMHLAEAYLTFNKLERAFQILNKAEKIYTTKKLNEYELRLSLNTQFVNYFEALGQWKKAYEHLRKLNESEKIKLLADRNGAITRLNVEYETEKKEALLNAQKKEISLNTQNLRLQQRFIVVTFALLMIAAGMSIVFFRLYRKNKRTSRRNEELVKEQNHRVKNNLQVVSSLLSLQSKRLTDESAKKAVEESRLRVQSMAILHQRLYDGDKLAEANLDEFIRELVGGVLRAYGYPSVQTQFSIDESSLSADKAVPLGLILNELTTNACKYAFPNNENPKFSISCYRKNNKIHVTVADNGPGWPGTGSDRSDGLSVSWSDTQLDWVESGAVPATLHVSFGMQLIQAQVEQLSGTYQVRSGLENESVGVVFTLEFKG
ncbi:histidine kinase dimerization/phosphoacceptor domain -containing protein [Spirosoma flavum]|uniref:histidine kinase n=1 Tax=Spirosoma flavum TaxID=2048557 RepID=A0ABW6AHL6_9BACT